MTSCELVQYALHCNIMCDRDGHYSMILLRQCYIKKILRGVTQNNTTIVFSFSALSTYGNLLL